MQELLDAGSSEIVELSSKVAILNEITVLAATSATDCSAQIMHRDDTMSVVMHVLHVNFPHGEFDQGGSHKIRYPMVFLSRQINVQNVQNITL